MTRSLCDLEESFPTALEPDRFLVYPRQPCWAISCDTRMVQVYYRDKRTTLHDFFKQSHITAEDRDLRGTFLPIVISAIQSCFLTGNISAEWNALLQFTEVYIRLDNVQYRWNSLEIHELSNGVDSCTVNLGSVTWDGTSSHHNFNVALVRDSRSKWIPEDKRWSSITMESRLEQHPIIQSMPSRDDLRVAGSDIGDSSKVGLVTTVHEFRAYSGQYSFRRSDAR